jgi:hypothetical protein
VCCGAVRAFKDQQGLWNRHLEVKFIQQQRVLDSIRLEGPNCLNETSSEEEKGLCPLLPKHFGVKCAFLEASEKTE